jgi:hypothetical protein
MKVAEYHTYFVGGEDWGFSVWSHNVICWHYSDKAGINGINASRSLKPSISKYAKHGVGSPVVFVTPLSPAQLAQKGIK